MQYFAKLMQAPKLQQRLEAVGNRPSGFDYMRIVLAIGVIVWHAPYLTGNSAFHESWFYSWFSGIAFLMVPMFFALSGFLVAGSLDRCKTLISFLGLRVFRIIPALAVEVLLSALLLGPLLTTYPLGDYFTDTRFHAYFLNILGEIHYYLPGVFETNPVTKVNLQLWTVPYELVCYVVLAVLWILGILFRPRLFMLAVFGVYFVQALNTVLRDRPAYIDGVPASSLVMAFLAGLLIYRFRHIIPWSRALFWFSLIVLIGLVYIPYGSRFTAFPLAYVTVYLGLLHPPRTRFIQSGDYSYGLYLYGVPIQQAFIALHPAFADWHLNLLATLPAALLVAYLSWHYVEAPAMKSKKILYKAEDRYLAAGGLRKILAALGAGQRKEELSK
jgi:peptidoglycan/LPS O-acetylase OafA/YrhL